MDATTTKPDQKTLIFAWLDALRSGEFKQTTECLADSDGGHCCLGVACRVAVAAGVPLEVEENDDGDICFDQCGTYLPPTASQMLGLRNRSGSFEEGALWQLNDGGATFPEIADIIEANALTLFKNGEEVAGWLAERRAAK
ncbi:MAG TPA: hypothetical protein VEA69_16905 [Tepidisphaeraceae bacterium]|nr:hypothetical protein [Tepidisphaeraceae bacterium]